MYQNQSSEEETNPQSQDVRAHKKYNTSKVFFNSFPRFSQIFLTDESCQQKKKKKKSSEHIENYQIYKFRKIIQT